MHYGTHNNNSIDNIIISVYTIYVNLFFLNLSDTKEHAPLYITIVQYDNDNQGCELLILLTSK